MASHSVTLRNSPDSLQTGVQLTAFSTIPDVNINIPGLKQDCTKLVMELNREMALYSTLLVIVGGAQDSCEAREELKSTRKKIFELANQTMTKLVPVLKKCRVCSEEMRDLERLYNMTSACLDLFEIEMTKTLTLQKLFPVAQMRVRTGVQETHVNCSKCQHSASDWNIGQEEITVLERDVTDLHTILDIIGRTIAVQPWAEDSDVKIIKMEGGFNSSITLRSEMSDTSNTSTMVSVEHNKKKSCICIFVMIVTSAIISGTVIGVCLAVL